MLCAGLICRVFRQKLERFLVNRKTQIVLICLLLLDVIFVSAELIIERYLCDDPHNHPLHQAETALRWCSLTILFIFAAESLLLIFALGKRWLRSPFYVIDLIVVTASIVLDFVLRTIEACAVH